MSEIKVLNHGFVRLVDHVGSDHSITNSARVSYGQSSKGEDADKKLIKYLLINKHTSPFEHVVFTFHIKAPIFVTRQWMRHRTWSYNEISYRYTEAPDEFFLPHTWRKQAHVNKQGSLGEVEEQQVCNEIAIQSYRDAMSSYERLIKLGVGREQARAVLPVSLYTQFYATVNLHNLLHFITLREDAHAQQEIQVYGTALRSIVSPIVPWTIEAWSVV
jgi:thymidylate synthase (FAD)